MRINLYDTKATLVLEKAIVEIDKGERLLVRRGPEKGAGDMRHLELFTNPAIDPACVEISAPPLFVSSPGIEKIIKPVRRRNHKRRK